MIIEPALLLSVLSILVALASYRTSRSNLKVEQIRMSSELRASWLGLRQHWNVIRILGHRYSADSTADIPSKDFREVARRLLEFREQRLEMVKAEEKESLGFGGDEQFIADPHVMESPLHAQLESIKEVQIFLNSVCMQVLSRRLSLDAVYQSIGVELCKHLYSINLTSRVSLDALGCPSVVREVDAGLRKADVWEIPQLINWEDAVSSAPGTQARAILLVKLMLVMSHKYGDSENPITSDPVQPPNEVGNDIFSKEESANPGDGEDLEWLILVSRYLGRRNSLSYLGKALSHRRRCELNPSFQAWWKSMLISIRVGMKIIFNGSNKLYV